MFDILAIKNVPENISEYSKSALEILRQPQLTMKWYIIPIFVLLVYVIGVELHHKNYKILLSGLALWGTDLFNEIWNGLVFYNTGAPVWGTPGSVGDTALLILIGYNVEISIMFFFMGLAFGHTLEAMGDKKLFGKVNNRIPAIIIATTAAVLVECFLNYAGVLTWEKSWWTRQIPYVLWLIGYLPFFVTATLAHDLPKKGQIITISTIYGVDFILLLVFGCLGWL